MAGKHKSVKKIILPLAILVIVAAVVVGYSMSNSRETELKAEETLPVDLEPVETPSPEKLSATTLDANSTADTESEDEIDEALFQLFDTVYNAAHTDIRGRINSWLTYELSILQEIGEQDKEESYKSWRDTTHQNEEDIIFTDVEEENGVYYVINKQGTIVLQNWLKSDAEILSKLDYADKVIVTGTGIEGTSASGYFRIEIDGTIGYIKIEDVSAEAPKSLFEEVDEAVKVVNKTLGYITLNPKTLEITDSQYSLKPDTKLTRTGIGTKELEQWSRCILPSGEVIYILTIDLTPVTPVYTGGGTSGSGGTSGGGTGNTNNVQQQPASGAITNPNKPHSDVVREEFDPSALHPTNTADGAYSHLQIAG